MIQFVGVEDRRANCSKFSSLLQSLNHFQASDYPISCLHLNVSSLTSVYSLENTLGQIAIYTRPAWECGFQLLSFLGDSNGGDNFEWILNGRAGRVKVNIYL